MTHKIPRAKVADESAFKTMVEQHARELTSHDAHMVKVAQNEADPYPAPTAHPDVDAAVRRDAGGRFTPDYSIVEHLPVRDGDRTGLAVRKEELRQKVFAMEQQAVHGLLPRGKWRAAAMRAEDATAVPEDERTDDQRVAVANYFARMKEVRAINLHHADLEAEVEDLNFRTVNDWSPAPYVKKG